MQIKFSIMSGGIAAPSTGLGVNLGTIGFIYFRSIEHETPRLLAIGNTFSLGSSSGTVVASHIHTKWSVINISRYPWLHSKIRLIGKRAKLTIMGTTIGWGDVAVRLRTFDVYNNPEQSLELVSQEALGIQFAATSVFGTIESTSITQLPKETQEDIKKKYEQSI